MIVPPRFRSLIAVWFALAVVLSHENSAAEPMPQKPPRKPVKLPGMVINLANGYVDLEGTIRVNDGFLELVACTKDTKEHESIVASMWRANPKTLPDVGTLVTLRLKPKPKIAKSVKATAADTAKPSGE